MSKSFQTLHLLTFLLIVKEFEPEDIKLKENVERNTYMVSPSKRSDPLLLLSLLLRDLMLDRAGAMFSAEPEYDMFRYGASPGRSVPLNRLLKLITIISFRIIDSGPSVLQFPNALFIIFVDGRIVSCL